MMNVLKNTVFVIIAVFLVLHIVEIAQPRAQVGEPEYVENELIVAYKPGLDPETLTRLTQTRAQKKSNPFGFFSMLLQNISYKLKGEDTPEERLSRLKKVEMQYGIIEQEKTDIISDFIVYIVRTDAQFNAMEIVEAFKLLPEVGYAEPSYLYEPF